MSERYELKGKIGEGGIGTVHKAFDTQLKREVAIKRLIPVEGGNSAEAAENLIKEATTLSSLQHPNIVTVYDVGSDEQGGFVVMELLKGETFDETINRGALTEGDFRNVVTQTLEALIAAHHSGLIHRDLKPSNLMVNWMPSGKFQIKILDFGLAKFSKQPSVQTIDQGDAILGSIYFMAPEQFERVPLDARTDLYSMGCMYYQCLTGKYPFDGETAPIVMASHLQNRVQPLSALPPDLPEWMCNWVMWLISRKMEDRPESARFAYEQFHAEKSSPEIEAAAAAAAQAVAAQQQAAPAFVPPTPAHPPAGYAATAQPPGGITGPLGVGGAPPPPLLAQKATFPKWAMVTIPVLICLAIIIAVTKFGGRGDRKAREALMLSLHEQIDDEETPQGDRSTVDTVVDYMIEHTADKDTTNSAIRILGALEGDGVDAAIVDNLPKIRNSTQLVGTLLTIAFRDYQVGLPAIMNYVTHKDADVSRAALNAVVELGGREQLPRLVELAVESAEAGKGGKPFSDTIIQIASTMGDADASSAGVREAAESLSGEARGAMLVLLGSLGGDAALATIEKALRGADKEAKKGALLGLGRWQDGTPNEILFKAATDKSDPQLQFIAISSYVQNVARPSPMSAENKVKQIEQIYDQIGRTRDKRNLFQALGRIIDPSALALAKKLAEQLAEDDQSIAKYARGAVAAIDEGLKNLLIVKDSTSLEGKTAKRDAYNDHAVYSDAPDMKAITAWSHPEDRVYWPLRFESPGTYSVEVTYACGQDDNDRYEMSVADQTLKVDVIATGGATNFKTEKVGEITISEPGGYTLLISPIKLSGEFLMNLRKVQLEKVN